MFYWLSYFKFEKELYCTFQSKDYNLPKLYIAPLLIQLKEWLYFTYIFSDDGYCHHDVQHVIQNQRMYDQTM